MGALGDLFFIGVAMAGLAVMMVGPFVGIIYWNKYERKKWLRVGDRLGLMPHPSSVHGKRASFFGRNYYCDDLVGNRQGLNVRLGVRVVVTGSGDSRSTTYYTYARVDFGRSLDLGLGVTPRNVVARFFGSLVGEKDVQVGDEAVDPFYTIHAADEAVASRMLGAPYVREALVALKGANFKPHIGDESLRCERVGKSFDPGALGVALDSAVDLARRLLAARETVGPSSAEHAVSTVWRDVAASLGFQLDVANTRMQGRAEGMHVEVDTQLRQRRRWTVFTVRFDRQLGVGLSLTRQGSLSALTKLFGAQDIELGDPVFDQRFVVKGSPEPRVRALLTPTVRALLVDLQGHATQLEVADDRLSAHLAWLVSDPAWLGSGIVAVARAGAALAQVSTEAPGPYRR